MEKGKNSRKPFARMWRIREWSIVAKVVVAACGLTALLFVMSGVMVIILESRMLNAITAQHAAAVRHAIDDRKHAEENALKEYITFIANLLADTGAVYVFEANAEGMQSLIKNYVKYSSVAAIQVRDSQAQPLTAAWKAQDFVFLGETLPDIPELAQTVLTVVDVNYQGRKVGQIQARYTDAALNKKIAAIRVQTDREAQQFERESQTRLDTVIFSQSLSLLIFLLALIVGLSVFLRTLIVKPLFRVSNIARQLTDFDLTVTMETNRPDEVGALLKAIHEMVRSFRGVIGQVQDAGMQVSSSSGELAATSKEQEVTLKHQVESINQILRSVTMISAVATQLVETMARVAAVSQETTTVASSGQADLLRMADVMHRMETASQAISAKLGAINEKTENITTVVTTITKVADQTNLLSLNAAIEAEKAGEYGRGFTVVAREIRRLADQTAVATLDIEQMVKEMQAAVTAGVLEMDKFIAEVRRSAADVQKISIQLTRIIEQVQTLAPQFEEIKGAMSQQSEHAQEIHRAMLNFSEEMQQTTESLRESFLAIKQLNEAAGGLQDEVSRFKLM